jgi:UDP-N-acetylmuramoyl-L-alanyl-D-glutamate--2,6-diaminopimelate ligase
MLAKLVPGSVQRGDAAVGGISCDSRLAGPGVLFCALPGRWADGHEFAGQAVTAGASALVVERFLDLPVAQLRVPSVRAALGPLSGAVHGWPSRRLRLAAVTGTDGKTTTAHLLERCLAASGRRTGSIGTIASKISDRTIPSGATTPEAPELHRLFAEMVRSDVQDVAMEVSSHGLDLGRVDGLFFEVAVFMNLSPEHLDHHQTMERYWQAKAGLFDSSRAKVGVVCVDDEWGERLASEATLPVVTFGRTGKADAVIEAVDTDLEGTRVHLRWRRQRLRLSTVIPGTVNADNATAAYLAARALGVRGETAGRALAHAPAVPGRFETIDAGQPFLVVVDYAHTAAALTALIDTARRLTRPASRVVLVVGARGGRYKDKRAAVGRAAAGSDLVVITTDSPGSEDPAAIADQLLDGCAQVAGARTILELDRETAIRLAIASALPGDIVLIVGRGHERSYERGREQIELDDREAARAALNSIVNRRFRKRGPVWRQHEALGVALP